MQGAGMRAKRLMTGIFQAMAAADEEILTVPERMRLRRIVRDGPFSIDVEPSVSLATGM